MGRQTPHPGSWCHLTVSSCSWHFHFPPSPRSSWTVCILFSVHSSNAEWQDTHTSSITHFICYLPVRLHSGFYMSWAMKGACDFNCVLALCRASFEKDWKFHEALPLRKVAVKWKRCFICDLLMPAWAHFGYQEASSPGKNEDFKSYFLWGGCCVLTCTFSLLPDLLSYNWQIKMLFT